MTKICNRQANLYIGTVVLICSVTEEYILKKNTIDRMADKEPKSSETNEETDTEETLNPENYLFVVALDFGTTYSGYAYSSRVDFRRNPVNIQSRMECQMNESLKTSTSLLIKKDGTFVAFGNKAEDMFYSEIAKEDRKDMMLFRRFKMNLHNKTGIKEGMLIEDVAGRKYSAKAIFTLSIKALVDMFKLQILKQAALNTVKKNDIKWVLTVPAIWSEGAKKYMRQCAIDAGIPDKMLVIALEPEAASIYVQYLPVERNQDGLGMIKEGTKYMVVDIGGGTADITVHEKISGGRLRELHQAAGGACGGTSVDNAFESRFTEILGEKVMRKLREDEEEAYLDIVRTFETAKRAITPDRTKPISIAIPYGVLEDICLDIANKSLKDFFEHVEGMKLKTYKLQIDAETMKTFFQPSIKKLIQHMECILKDSRTQGISFILLVGGTASSALVQNEVTKSFSSMRLIVPPEAELAVLRGAVIFGHNPKMINSRVLRFTYGTTVCQEFDPKIHKEEKKITINGQDICKDCFCTILPVGTEVEIGTKEVQTYSPAVPFQQEALVKVFCSPKKEVKYTDDEDCFQLGELHVSFKRDFLASIFQFPFTVEYTFGDTELKLRSIDLVSGVEGSCTLQIQESNDNQES